MRKGQRGLRDEGECVRRTAKDLEDAGIDVATFSIFQSDDAGTQMEDVGYVQVWVMEDVGYMSKY